MDLTNLPVYSSTRLHWQKVVWKTERSEKQFIIYSSTCLPVYTRKKSVPDFLAAWPIQRLSPQVLHWSHLLFFWCVVSLSLTVLTFCEWSRIWGESDPPPPFNPCFQRFLMWFARLLVYRSTGLFFKSPIFFILLWKWCFCRISWFTAATSIVADPRLHFMTLPILSLFWL